MSQNPNTLKTRLTVLQGGFDPARDPELLQARLRGYEANRISASTRRAYLSDWNHFAGWCDRHARQALPAQGETVALYLADYSDRYKPATLGRRVVAISQVHEAGGHESPTRTSAVRAALRGIRRERGTAQTQKAPLLVDELKLCIDALPHGTMQATRDRLLLLLGWATGLRRSEIVAMNTEDVKVKPEGVVVTVRRSKTDQEGKGRKIGVARARDPLYCPVDALVAWLDATGITRGPLFLRIDRHERILLGQRLRPQAVAIVVKRAGLRVGLDPAEYAGHSLRSGLATSAAQAGANERDIMRTTGHKSEAMVRRYIREAELFRANPAATAGL